MVSRPDRRALLLGAAAMTLHGPLRAEPGPVVNLAWIDLLPVEERFARTALPFGVVEHSDLESGFEQPPSTGVTTRYDGRTVRLPGYMAPLDYDGTAAGTFILAPYRGACIHVPPPPANQLVLVTAEEPYRTDDPLAAVMVEGAFRTARASTGLAATGYALTASSVTRHRR